MEKKTRSKWMVFAVTGIANFGFSYTNNSLNLALPFLREQFGVTQSDVSWLPLVYTLVSCCLLLLFGNLGDIFGYRRQFQLGFSSFAVISVLAPLLSNSIAALIFFRALQGVSYSMVVSLTQAAVNRAFDPSERGKAIGINVVFVSAGMVSGPIIGGFLLAYFSWHAIFYLSAAFGALGFLGTFVALDNDTVKDRKGARVDAPGAAFFSLFIGALCVGFNFSDEWGFLSLRFGFFLLLSALGFVLFLRRESRTEHPLMPLSLFQNRTFALANGVSFFAYVAQQLTFYLFPFFLADILLLPSDRAGLVLLSSSILMMAASPVGGLMTDRFGAKPSTIAGMLLIALSCLMTALFRENTGIPYVMVALAFLGMGGGLSTPGFNTVILSSAPRDKSGVASGTLATTRTVGVAIGTALASVMLAVREEHYLAASAVQTKAYLLAQRDTFLVGVVLALFAAGLMACLPRRDVKNQICVEE